MRWCVSCEVRTAYVYYWDEHRFRVCTIDRNYVCILENVVRKTLCGCSGSYFVCDVSLAPREVKNKKSDVWKFSMLLSEFSKCFVAWIYGRLLTDPLACVIDTWMTLLLLSKASPFRIPSYLQPASLSARIHLPLGVELLSMLDSATSSHRAWISQLLLRMCTQNLIG
jgi:hypothetical protein